MPQNPTRQVHLRKMEAIMFHRRNRGACLDQLDNQWEYTAKWQTHKPYKAMETREVEAVDRLVYELYGLSEEEINIVEGGKS